MRNFNDVLNSVDEAINNAKKNGSIDEVINKTKEYAKKSAQAIEISRKRIELLDTKTKPKHTKNMANFSLTFMTAVRLVKMSLKQLVKRSLCSKVSPNF